MSAVAAVPASERPTPFTRLLRAELRKSVNTVASFWLVASVGIIIVIVDGFLTIATVIQGGRIELGDFAAITASITSVILPVLGIMLVTSEWSQRTAMVTFSLEPRRVHVLMAKLVVGLVLTLATAVISVVVAVACTAVCGIVNPHETSWHLGAEFLGGFLVTQCLAMVGGFALATLLLNTPAAIVLFFVYRWVIPVVLYTISDIWADFARVSPFINLIEAQEPLFDLSLNTGAEWAHLLVGLLIWVVIPLGLGLWRILRAEVK